MATPAIDPYYYQSRMRELAGQKELTTGRGLTSAETTGILDAELQSRYAAEDRRRQYALQQEQLAIQKDANERAAKAAEGQALAATVGGVGQLALGSAALYGTGKQAGWWGATTPAVIGTGVPAVSAADTAALASTAAIDPATGLVTTGYGGVAGTPATGGVGGGVSSVALPAAAAAADIWSAETIRRGTSAYGRGGQSVTPWADDTGWGVAANLIFPLPGAIGGAVNTVKTSFEKLTGTKSVICTELSRQGYIPQEILDYEHIYRLRHIGYGEYTGYRKLADPIIPLMQKSKIVTWLILPFGKGVAYEMAHRANPEIKGSRIGCFVLKHGLPICRWIAKRRKSLCLIY